MAQFLAPLLIELDARVEKRFVRTFLNTVAVILTFRDRVNGLLLSELGGYLSTPDQAEAWTKRLSRLLHCLKWSAELIRAFLWERATQRLKTWKEVGVQALAIWDESVWEKPESIAPEEYGPVRGSQGRSPRPHQERLLHPATRSHFCARADTGWRCSWSPWTSDTIPLSVAPYAALGPVAVLVSRSNADAQGKLLLQLALRWGRDVLHVFDQGFSSSFWLGLLFAFNLRFVLRWKKDSHLVDAQSNRRAAWKIARGKRGRAGSARAGIVGVTDG